MSARLFDIFDMRKRAEDKGQAPSGNHALLRLGGSLFLRLMINGVVPVLIYLLLHHLTHSQVLALTVAGAIPIGGIVLRMARKRRIELIGALAAAGFAGALVVAFAAKGNPLALKLYHSAILGAIGVTLLISVIGRRSFVLNALRRMASENPRLQSLLKKLSPGADGAQTFRVAAAIVAVTLLVEAATHTVLAFTVSTAAYLIIGRVAGWTIRGIGAITLVWYIRRVRTHHPVSSVNDERHAAE